MCRGKNIEGGGREVGVWYAEDGWAKGTRGKGGGELTDGRGPSNKNSPSE